MNWNTFSLIGYLSVLLWVAVPLLWLIHRRRRRWRWLCPLALVLALVSFACARINSETHVNRIELDRSGQIAGQEARDEAKRKAAEDGRAREVAQIRFAEDATGDFLDKAGMDEADLKYMENLNPSSAPEWKKAKKTRGEEATQDDDLESMLGGKAAVEGMEADALQEAEEKPPVLMSDAGMAMAHRLDGLNLKAALVMILLAILMVVFDYLGRANLYAVASRPIPLPSAWLNGVTPIPPVEVRPAPARRSMRAELAWLVKRGDSFVYLTDDPAAAAGVPSSLPRLGPWWRPVDVLSVTGEEITDDFIFEALWYRRSCFVVDSPVRAERMLARFLELMEERKKFRARTAQTVHIVWALSSPLSPEQQDMLAGLAQATGFRLFLCGGNYPGQFVRSTAGKSMTSPTRERSPTAPR